jgi:branched-chain amino acid transport system substrate-binding protein
MTITPRHSSRPRDLKLRMLAAHAKDITPAGVREALTYTDMQSMYGQIKFISYGKKRQQNSLPTYLGQWQDGRFELVWPKEYADRPFVYPIPPWPK